HRRVAERRSGTIRPEGVDAIVQANRSPLDHARREGVADGPLTVHGQCRGRAVDGKRQAVRGADRKLLGRRRIDHPGLTIVLADLDGTSGEIHTGELEVRRADIVEYEVAVRLAVAARLAEYDG